MLPGKVYRPEDYVEILWRRKWLVIVPFVVITLLTVIATQFIPDRYTSEARILVIPQQVPTKFVEPTVTSELSARLQAMSQQIQSRTRLEGIVQELNLYEEERRTMIMEDVVELMRRNIAIQIPRFAGDRDAPSFSVAFSAENARSAMQVAERLSAQFISESLQDRTVQADQTSQFLETQLEEARRKLSDHEQKFAVFRKRYEGELPTQVQSNLAVMQSTQAQLQAVAETIGRDRDRQLVLDKTIADLMAISSASERATSPRDSSEPPTAAQQLESARAGLRALQTRLKPDHPDVVRMLRVVKELEDKAATEELSNPVGVGIETARAGLPTADLKRLSEMQAERESLDRRIVTSQAEEARLLRVLSNYRTKLEAAPGREAEATELMRDYDTLDEQYRTLLGRSQQSRIAADLERRQIGEQFRLLEPARLPLRPVSPDRGRLNTMGALVGLALGLALIALVEYRDTTLRTEDDFAISLALPVLAVIPAMMTRPERQRTRKRRMVAIAASAVAMAGAIAVIVWKIDDFANWVR